jgi:hypothetical protein
MIGLDGEREGVDVYMYRMECLVGILRWSACKE